MTGCCEAAAEMRGVACRWAAHPARPAGLSEGVSTAGPAAWPGPRGSCARWCSTPCNIPGPSSGPPRACGAPAPRPSAPPRPAPARAARPAGGRGGAAQRPGGRPRQSLGPVGRLVGGWRSEAKCLCSVAVQCWWRARGNYHHQRPPPPPPPPPPQPEAHHKCVLEVLLPLRHLLLLDGGRLRVRGGAVLPARWDFIHRL